MLYAPVDSLTTAILIDARCDEFERHWKTGSRPQLSAFTNDVPPSMRARLQYELLALDISIRKALGEHVKVEDYSRELQNLAPQEITQVFSQLFQCTEVSDGESRVAEALRPSEITFPSKFGPFDLLESIGRGGMGMVFKARQLPSHRIVAVKMNLGGQYAQPEQVQRFQAEAQLTSRLDHPGIVPIYGIGHLEGYHFYYMEYLDGGNLAQRLREGPVHYRQATEWLHAICQAVHHAHLQGIIHRDLKPSNVLLDANGQPRIADFGLAKLQDSDSDLTYTGQAIGTPGFMPPEQAAGQLDAIGPASDVYALGALLYALLTGRPPFRAACPLEALMQIQHFQPICPRKLNASIPLNLATIVLKCLERSPDHRYQTAAAVANDLDCVLNNRPIFTRRAGRLERLWEWCHR